MELLRIGPRAGQGPELTGAFDWGPRLGNTIENTAPLGGVPIKVKHYNISIGLHHAS